MKMNKNMSVAAIILFALPFCLLKQRPPMVFVLFTLSIVIRRNQSICGDALKPSMHAQASSHQSLYAVFDRNLHLKDSVSIDAFHAMDLVFRGSV